MFAVLFNKGKTTVGIWVLTLFASPKGDATVTGENRNRK